MSFRVLLDTSILVDAAIPSRPQHSEARHLIEMLACGKALGHVSPLSLKDFFCITRKGLTDAEARKWIGLFTDPLDVVPVDRDTCERALRSDDPDFEDALIEAAVEDSRSTYLISRDLEGFGSLRVPRITAAEFLEVMEDAVN